MNTPDFEPQNVLDADFDISLFCGTSDTNPLDDEKFDFSCLRNEAYYAKKFPLFTPEIHQILAKCSNMEIVEDEPIIEDIKKFTIDWN